jgi:murein DD-endopeptidase MepM/ murein hydrolase activator NlpD
LPVHCIANGFVEKIIKWNGVTKGFGNHIFVKHTLPDGTIVYSHYCHLDSISCSEGVDIDKSAEIGKCGGSGGWPSHLHMEIRKPLGKGYDFWPKGMSEGWVASNYYDPYGFIEKRLSPQEDTLQVKYDKCSIQKDTFFGLLLKIRDWLKLSGEPSESLFEKEIKGFIDLEDKVRTLERLSGEKDQQIIDVQNEAKRLQKQVKELLAQTKDDGILIDDLQTRNKQYDTQLTQVSQKLEEYKDIIPIDRYSPIELIKIALSKWLKRE